MIFQYLFKHSKLAVLYWPDSILLILIKDQLGIICDPTLDIDEVPQGVQTRANHTHQSEHDHLEFDSPETALLGW